MKQNENPRSHFALIASFSPRKSGFSLEDFKLRREIKDQDLLKEELQVKPTPLYGRTEKGPSLRIRAEIHIFCRWVSKEADP